MLRKKPKEWSKERFIRAAINFAVRTNRPQDLVRAYQVKSKREQVRVSDEALTELHERAKLLGISAGELVNRAIAEMYVRETLLGKPEYKPKKKKGSV